MELFHNWYRAVGVSFVVNGPKVEDEGQMFMVPWTAHCDIAACIDMDGFIEGKVMVRPLVSEPVVHGGIRVAVEQYVHLRDPFVSTEIGEQEEELCGPGVLEPSEEWQAFPFRLKLRTGPHALLWLEGYNGEAFAVRHTLRASVLRPWPNWQCDAHVPLQLYRIHLAGRDMPDVHTPCRICVDVGDAKPVSRNYLELDSEWAPTNGPLRLRVGLAGLTTPLEMGRVLLIKGEFVGRVCAREEVLISHLLFGADATDPDGSGDGGVEEEQDTGEAASGIGGKSGSSRNWNTWFADDTKAPPIQTRGLISRKDDEELNTDEDTAADQPVFKGTRIVAEVPLGPLNNAPHGSVRADDHHSAERLRFLDLSPSFDTAQLCRTHKEHGDREDGRTGPSSGRVTSGEREGDDDAATPQESEIQAQSVVSTTTAPAAPTSWLGATLQAETAPRLDAEEQVVVRYFVRFVLRDAHGSFFWNTDEIHLFRSSIPLAASASLQPV